ncbi:putative two-component system sensor kinase [Nocardia nova SH22a]|uniref:histidine kinase n=1 Tax=Nocardia nova SH22a TaxID=1415166 RepID=W5TVG4_9NOCA|nr:HAMP domain-containing sensor histidine kinase [Nocardia nova]AHH21176.1 putative two-component system sensor kinase [Nocardia nova SH22a]
MNAPDTGPRPLPTVSLRRRVTLTAATVSGIALIIVALAVHALFGIAVGRSANTVLTDRVQLARQLALQDTPPDELIMRIDNRSVRARLELADGTTYGSLSPRRAAEGGATRKVTLTGPGAVNDARLTVQVDTPLLTILRARLGRVLIAVTLAAIVIITAALWFGLRRALRPLDSMTRLAREIARGGRGRRLSPTRTDTELGRTAGAFDEMLDALEGAEARARASEQRMRDFVGDAAHELRTPIAGIRAMAEAVLHQPADTGTEEREHMYLLLAREARRAGRLVDDLLDMARIDAGLTLHREDVDLYDLARAEVDRMRVLRPDVDFHLTGRSTPAVVDPERIAQVLANLMSNACHAMPDGGTVGLDIGAGATPDLVAIRVTDTGPGVPESERIRIFDRLVRLDTGRDHRRDGAGMGLAIARGIARAHGGDLRCVAPDTTGAVFVLVLPLREPA